MLYAFDSLFHFYFGYFGKNKFAKLAGKGVSTLRSARYLRLLPLSMYSQMKKQRRLLHQPVALQA